MARRAPWIYAPSPEEKAEKAEAARVAKQAERWGVFVWEPANMYRAESALKIYKRECGQAQRRTRSKRESGCT